MQRPNQNHYYYKTYDYKQQPTPKRISAKTSVQQQQNYNNINNINNHSISTAAPSSCGKRLWPCNDNKTTTKLQQNQQ
jgi:hypothetical protein